MGIGVGIGTAVMAWMGSATAAAAVAGGAALAGGMALAAGAIGGALIGAAVGGLTAAVMGGDIGKGMLFGAVGGAVTGGLSGYMASPGLSGASMAVEGADSAGYMTQHVAEAQGVVQTAGGASGASGGGWSATLKETGKGLMKEVGGSVISEAAKGVMASWGAEDQREWDAEQAALAHERDLAKIKLNGSLSSSGTDNTAARLAYKARMAELDQRKTEFDTNTEFARTQWNTEQQRKKDRKELLRASGNNVQQTDSATGGKSIQEKRAVQNISQSPAAPGAVEQPASAAPETAMEGV